MAEVLGIAASVIAVVDMSTKVLNLCSRYAHDVKKAKDDIERLRKEVIDLQITLGQVDSLVKGAYRPSLTASSQLLHTVKDADSTLRNLAQTLEQPESGKRMGNTGLRALKWPFKSKDIEGILQRLTRCRDNLLLALNVDQTTRILDVDYNIAMDKLPIAKGASFDSHAEEHNPTCLPNTRVQLLQDITRWIEHPDSRTLFWLKGMAGTGKSTISRTVARSRSDYGDLGACFLFKRGEADRGNLAKFMPTLAYQLASRSPGIAPFIKDAIDANPAIVWKTVREQFEMLIQGPLSKALGTMASVSRLVIVIDALDECERDDDIRLLINLLSSTAILGSRFRVFLTSRPELPIRLGFSQIKDAYQDLALHEMPTHVVKQDISVFLAGEFEEIRKSFNATVVDDRKLATTWPGHQVLQDLTTMAVPLFIFAATLSRFVNDRNCGSPHAQLRKILNHRSQSHGSQLDRTYGPVLMSQLHDQLSKDDREQIVNDFILVVGTIMTLTNPLSVSSLSRLLDVDRDVVDSRLDMLHSVLSVPPGDSPVRLLHLSFRDYLVDAGQKESNAFWVDERSIHRNLATNCLRVMEGGLGENICGMSFPGMRRSAVDSQRIATALQPELQYACRYWAHHLTATDFEDDIGRVLSETLKVHLLHWLEVMSLMGCVGESLDMIRCVVLWLEDRGCQELSNFFSDAVRFVKASFLAIDETPLQLYSSALVFAPSRSVVRSSFQRCIARWLALWPQVNENWDACLAVLEGHTHGVSSVVFSSDSKILASASDDKTVRIWDVETGACNRVLEGHTGLITSVVFSSDSKTLASASGDNTVRIWVVETGACKRVLEGHTDWVKSVVFSPDSKTLASASDDKTVRIWDVETGACKKLIQHRGIFPPA